MGRSVEFCQIFESGYLSREWEFCKSAKPNVVQLVEIYLPTKFQVEIRKFLDKQTNKLLPISKVDIHILRDSENLDADSDPDPVSCRTPIPI